MIDLKLNPFEIIVNWFGKNFLNGGGFSREIYKSLGEIHESTLSIETLIRLTNKLLKIIICLVTIAIILVIWSGLAHSLDFSVAKDGSISLADKQTLWDYSKLSGSTGIELIKQENGAWLQTIFVEANYKVDKKLNLSALYSENFSVMRGCSPFKIGNHHSFRYGLGIEYSPFANGLTFYTKWDNRSLISEHDPIFVEEFGSNRNIFGAKYKF